MVKGIFTILIPHESDYYELGSYAPEVGFKFKITDNIFLRLHLDHEKSEYNIRKFKDVTIASYLHNLSGKIARKIKSLLIGVVLDEKDDTEKLRHVLKNAAEELEKLNLIGISKEEIEEKLKNIYFRLFDTSFFALDPEFIKNKVIDYTKELLTGKKKDRVIAQELLKYIEEGLHHKISENYEQAEKALKENDLKDAAKYFEKAAEIAEKLMLTDLAKKLRGRSKNSGKIPILRKNMEEAAQKARNFLKNEDFYNANIYYLKASEIAKELMDAEKQEEYSLKAKALKEFHEIDQRFKKK
ncbi:MAG: hypothetical protein ACTSQS_01940 [Promethearchaeota archaeon]